MPGATTVRKLGNQLEVLFEDGSRAIGYPTGRGYWAVGSSSQSQGGDGTVGSGPVVGGADVPDTVDDYPWPHGPVGALSPLRYGYRECVDFVAWRLNRDAGSTSAPWKYDWGDLRLTNGDAIGWKPDWLSHGWAVSSTPHAGWVGWYGTSAGALGHVNYVQKVNADGSIVLEEYNWGEHHHEYNTRTESPGALHFPDSFLSPPPR